MKSHTEEKRIRPDILTGAVFFSAALMFVFGIVTQRVFGNIGAFFAAGPMALYLFFYLALVLSVQKAVYIMVRLRARRSQYLNAEANMQRSMRIFGITGVISGALVMALSYTMANSLFGAQRGFFQILFAGAAVLFLGIQGVLRGYLQGIGYTRPIMLSDLIIAAVTFVTGTVFTIILYSYGLKVNDLFHIDEFASVYGSVGMMAGVLAGAIAGFIHILISFQVRKNEISEFVKTGAPRYLDNKNDVLTGIRPIILLYATPALMIFADQCFYCIYNARFHADSDYRSVYGIFAGRVLYTTALLAVLCCIPFLKSLNRVMARFERDELEGARERFRFFVRHASMLFMPVTVFVFAVNGTLLTAVFGKSSALASGLIMLGSLIIYLAAFAVCFSWLISHMGKSVASMLNIGIGWGVHVICLVLFVAVLNMGAYGLELAIIIPFLVYDLLCFLEISKVLSYKKELLRNFLLPAASAAIAGIVVFLLNNLTVNVIGDILTLLMCIVIYWFVYMLVMIVLRGVRLHELNKIPFGSIFMGIAAMIQTEENF